MFEHNFAINRGGGEFGIDWRNQGSKAYKQNVFNDFQACSEYLISADYTNTSKLTIQACVLQPKLRAFLFGIRL